MSPSRTSADLSAPSAHVPGSGLLDLLKSVPDPRGRRGRQHHLSAVLAVGLAAVIAGAKSFVAIGEWVAHQPIETLRDLGITTPTGPDESTIRRVFALLDADVLVACRCQVLACLHGMLVSGRSFPYLPDKDGCHAIAQEAPGVVDPGRS